MLSIQSKKSKMNTLQLLRDETSETEAVLDELRVMFYEVDFRLYRSDDSLKFINCFVAIFMSAESCVALWEKVNSSIAVASQRFLSSGVTPWNLYLLVSTPEKLTKIEKYKIENDRFAARKITLSDAELLSRSSDRYRDALEDAILGTDIELSVPSDAVFAIPLQDDEESAIRRFLFSKNNTVPADRKPASAQLRKKYIEELIEIGLGT